MMLLIDILLFLLFVSVNGQNATCSIKIIDAVCTDDTIHFNISVTDGCPKPIIITYTYKTDVDSTQSSDTEIIPYDGSYFDVPIDTVRDAWDYTLTVGSPQTTEPISSKYTAHCGGKESKLLLYVTGGLSGFFVLSGALLCFIRAIRAYRPTKPSEKRKIDVAVINA